MIEHPQLQPVVKAFESASERLHALISTLPEGRWAERSDPDRWSVGECVVHLNLTSEAFVTAIAPVLEELSSGENATDRRYRRSPLGWLLGKTTGPLFRLGPLRVGRMPTAPPFEPTVVPPMDVAMNTFDRLQREQVALVDRSDGRPIDRVRIPSPFAPRIEYDVYSALVLLPAHQHRHIEQAEGVWG